MRGYSLTMVPTFSPYRARMIFRGSFRAKSSTGIWLSMERDVAVESITIRCWDKINVPEARAAMDKFKMEAAAEVGVNLKEGYNGDLSSREAGSVGGQMVKKMIESYEKNL